MRLTHASVGKNKDGGKEKEALLKARTAAEAYSHATLGMRLGCGPAISAIKHGWKEEGAWRTLRPRGPLISEICDRASFVERIRPCAT